MRAAFACALAVLTACGASSPRAREEPPRAAEVSSSAVGSESAPPVEEEAEPRDAFEAARAEPNASDPTARMEIVWHVSMREGGATRTVRLDPPRASLFAQPSVPPPPPPSLDVAGFSCAIRDRATSVSMHLSAGETQQAQREHVTLYCEKGADRRSARASCAFQRSHGAVETFDEMPATIDLSASSSTPASIELRCTLEPAPEPSPAPTPAPAPTRPAPAPAPSRGGVI